MEDGMATLQSTKPMPVLVEMQFPVESETAVRLFSKSETEKCLSVYPDEWEVLLLPGTKFQVTKIEDDGQTTMITWKNISIKLDPVDILKIMSQENFLNEMSSSIS